MRNSDTQLSAEYRPTGPVQIREKGALEHWLTERYCLYTVIKDSVYRAEIHHQPWPLQDATAEFSTNTMASAAGIQLPAIQPLLHFAKRLEVLIWPLKRARQAECFTCRSCTSSSRVLLRAVLPCHMLRIRRSPS